MNYSLRALCLLLFLTSGPPAYAQVTTIDFSDFSTCDRRNPPPYGPPCVNISNQYASRGVVFLATPYYPISVWEDMFGATWIDTSGVSVPVPYLASNSPAFYGPITARFVDSSNPSKYVTRSNVQFEGCGFDTVGSTTVYWLNVNGAVIASQANTFAVSPPSDPNIFTMCAPMVAPGPVGGFTIQITCTGTNCEPGGYDIDNVQFGPEVFCANSGAPNCNQDPSKDKDLGCNDGNVGDPCNPGTGNQYERETDYAGPTMAYTRSYNSGLSMDVGLGYGWVSTYHKQLEFYVDGTLRSRRADGRSEPFYKSGSLWQPDPDSTSTLTQNSSGYVLTTPDKTVETYDLTGRILSETDRTGKALTYTYNTNGQLTQVTNTFGMMLSFSYGADGHLQSLTDPAGKSIQYTYDTLGNLSSVTDATGAARTYLYENTALPHALTGITDEAANRFASWAYDANGRASSSSQAGGVDQVTLAYNSDGSTTVTDALGTARVYTFVTVLGATKNTSISQPCTNCGNAAARTYDSHGNVTSKVDFQGNRTCYAYDTTRNLETVRVEGFAPTITACPSNLASYTPASGTRQRKTTTTWNATFPFPASIVQANRTFTYNYDGSGNLLTKTITDTSSHSHNARSWTYTYGSYGQMLTADGPRTDVVDKSTYSYYSCTTGYQCGQLNTVTDALGHVTTYNAYNAYAQPLTITDPNGVVTNFTYDPRQRRTSRQLATELTTFAYLPTGLLQKATLPDSSYLLYSYDAAHRLTQIADTLGNAIDYTLDAMGNRVGVNVYDPASVLHRTHTRVFNALNQLYQDINAAGTAAVSTTFGYDGNGNLTSANAPLGRITSNLYDELDRVKQVTDPGSGITQFAYDANDNLVQVTDPRSLVASYTYDGFGGVTSQVSPDAGTIQKTYDSGGNLSTVTDARSAVATYTYDALNRMRTAAFKVGKTTDQTITYTYDSGTNGNGRLTGASDANHSMSWSYDGLGRVISKKQTIGTVTTTVGYIYTNGDLTGITTPSGQSIVYGYNTNHQLTSVTVNGTTILNSVGYEPLGPVNGWTWGNGTTVSRSYDTDSKISSLTSAGVESYSYDDAFRITGITDTATGSANWTYGYDSLDRLTSAIGGATTRGWSYDANGNRLTETGSSPTTYTVSASSNRISSTTGSLARTYSYDSAGNVLSYATATLTYYNNGRLKTVKKGSTTETLVYNALGQMVETSGGTSGTVLYCYDEAGHLLGEYSSTGALVEEMVWLGDIPVATLRPGTPTAIYYIHTDHLNVPRQITRPSDNLQMWTWFSDPFGTTLPNANPAGAGAFANNLRFPGQVFDGQVGLHQNYFRDYDPGVGRYVESDPAGLDAGPNTYWYANASPVSYFDANGMQALEPADEVIEREMEATEPSWTWALRPYRPSGLEPFGSYNTGGQDACGVCFNVFFVARISGFSSRGTDSAQGNRQFYDYLTSSNGPLNWRYITRGMQGPNGSLRNPTGFEWHHPRGRPNELWLVAQCQHRGDIWQPLIHPGGFGGFAERYIGPPQP